MNLGIYSMLKSFYLDGFKSLEKWHLELTPGLNVLVGENDTGKSNILSGLEFSTHVINSGLTNIPQKLGVDNWDSLYCISRDEKVIHLKISGENQSLCRNLKLPLYVSDESLDKFICLNTNYQYQCKIELNPRGSGLARFLSQELILNFCFFGDENYQPSKIVVGYENDTLELKEYQMRTFNEHISRKLEIDTQNPGDFFVQPERDSLLLNLKQSLYPIENLTQELMFSRAFEIQPSIVRIDNKSTTESEIQFNGRGLPTVFLDLKENSPEIYDFIVEEIKLLSEHLLDFEVSYNEVSKKIEIFAKKSATEVGGTYEKVPFELLSDGVLKWMTMVVVTVLTETALIIDEPENFLFPEIQQEFVTFMRNILKQKEQFGVITSHSNVLIDALEPEEIIVVQYKNGRTTTKRISDLDKFHQAMRKSEVGLGWYFQSGTLELYCN